MSLFAEVPPGTVPPDQFVEVAHVTEVLPVQVPLAACAEGMAAMMESAMEQGNTLLKMLERLNAVGFIAGSYRVKGFAKDDQVGGWVVPSRTTPFSFSGHTPRGSDIVDKANEKVVVSVALIR